MLDAIWQARRTVIMRSWLTKSALISLVARADALAALHAIAGPGGAHHPVLLRHAVLGTSRHARCSSVRAADLKAKKETRGGINLARTEASGEPSHSRLAEIPDFGGTGRLIKSARRASYEVQPNMKVSNMKKRATKLAAARVDAFTSSISVSLREKQRTLNDLLRRLAPFEAELAVLSLRALEKSGGRSLESVINDFDKMRRAVVRVGKEASAAASTAENKRVSEELVVAGEEAVEETLEQESWALDELNRLAIQLRRLPRVEQVPHAPASPSALHDRPNPKTHNTPQ